ncbi:MAG TPA: ABC transporter permease [Desulfurococcaceae archaeon]|nr:ABC transporter permease [Desulfurococcaceae archaeon]
MGVGTILLRRGIILIFVLIAILFLTAIIIGASGYDTIILKAIVQQQIQAYKQAIQRRLVNITEEEFTRMIEEYQATLEKSYGLDKPWYERVLPNVYRILTLNLGNATSEDVCQVGGLTWPCKVADVVMATLPRTIIMITVAELICAAIALPIGPWIAYRRGSIADRIVVGYAALFNAVPVWWLGLVFIYVFSYNLGIAPTNFRGIISAIKEGSLVEILRYAWLPIVVVVIAFLGGWLYYTRSMVLRVITEDFVMVARAKGLPERLVVRRHIVRVAAPPIVTYTVLALASSIGGFIITESVFDWPGMGTLYYTAIMVGDANTLIALIFITTVVYIAARFVLEILYVLLDPRVRL